MRPPQAGMLERGIRRALSALVVVTVGLACGKSPSDPDPGPDPATNRAPTATGGPDQTVSARLPVTLAGSGSDPDGDALTYAWTLTSPSGSGAALDDAASATPTFVPDLPGSYVASLRVNDGTVDSPPDDVSITAQDNTATQSIGAAGGAVGSTDGGMTLTVPAAALASDESIAVTLVADGQLPASLSGLGGPTTAYDLQPSGLQFASPAEVAFVVDGAASASAGTSELRGALLYSESDGVVELLAGLTYEASASDPTQVVAKGALDHFSFAAAVEVIGLDFSVDGPASAEVDEVFDVTVTLDITGAPVGDIIEAVMDDLSTGPIALEGNLNSVLGGSGTERTIVNQYRCTDVGTGKFGALIIFDAADVEAFATVRVGLDIECAGPPVELFPTFTQAFRANRFVPVPGTTYDLALGGAVRRFDALAGQMTLDVSVAGPASPGDSEEWVHALSDGTYMVHTVLGSALHADPSAAKMVNDTVVELFSQPRDLRPYGADAVALVSHFGDFGILRYNPGAGVFTDAFRDLQSTLPQQPDIHLQAIWLSPDGQVVIGMETTGSGDAVSDPAQLVLVDFDEQQGTVSTRALTATGATVLNERVDPEGVDRDPELVCRDEGSSTYLCVLTNGRSRSGFDSGLSRIGGLMKIFRVDAQAATATRLASDNTASRAVGGIVSSTDGSKTYAAVLNQRTAALEVWRVQGSSFIPEPSATFPIDAECPNPVDMIALDDGERVVIACHTQTNGPQSGILMFENMREVLQSLP